MPNWVTNNIILKGSDENLLRLLNTILKNSNEDEQDNISDALEKVQDSAKRRVWNNELGRITFEDGLHLSALRPIPETFLRYDTTNQPDIYKEEAQEQSRKYGVVGWYDYNLRISDASGTPTSATSRSRSKGFSSSKWRPRGLRQWHGCTI